MLKGKSGPLKMGFVRVADSVAGLNEQSMGDERESQVILRAYTFALVTGMFALMITGAILSLFGYWGFALSAVLLGAFQSYLAIAYAAANNVSLFALETQTSSARKLASLITFLVIMVVFFGARGYQIYAGKPMLERNALTENGNVPTSDFWSMLAGAVCGLVFVFVAQALISRRRQRQTPNLEDEE